MALQINHRVTGSGGARGAVPTAVLDNLATRFRPAGLFLALLKSDGTILYHDGSAGLFFQRYVLPLLQYEDSSDSGIKQQLGTLTATSPVTVWNHLPGVILAAFPHVDRRQLAGILVLAGKSATFKLSEDVVRVCSRLGLDGIWLNQQAEETPTFTDESIQRQSRMLLTMMRDQVRLASMEGELDSLSGQLANTYEELSLIYQISGGMRINRRANDFFKQACLDVLEVMGVQGMGVALSGDAAQRQEPVMYGPLSLPPGTVHRLTSELMPVLFHRKSPLLINELAKDKTFHWLSEHAHHLLAVPLQRQDQVLGCLFALDKNSGDFDSQDSKLLNSIANESAIYLENAMLFDDVHGLMMGLLHSLTSAVDAKDAYTCGHSERVAAISRQLTLEAGLPDALAERIYMAAARRGEDRRAGKRAAKDRPADAGRIRADETPSADRRQDSSGHQTNQRHYPRRAASPRAIRRAGISRATDGRKHSHHGPVDLPGGLL